MLQVVTQSSLKNNTFFVALEHCCIRTLYEDFKDQGYVACTCNIPYHVVPRPALPSGNVMTIDDMITIHYAKMTRIDPCATCRHRDLCAPGNWQERIDWVCKQGYLDDVKIPDD